MADETRPEPAAADDDTIGSQRSQGNAAAWNDALGKQSTPEEADKPQEQSERQRPSAQSQPLKPLIKQEPVDPENVEELIAARVAAIQDEHRDRASGAGDETVARPQRQTAAPEQGRRLPEQEQTNARERPQQQPAPQQARAESRTQDRPEESSAPESQQSHDGEDLEFAKSHAMAPALARACRTRGSYALGLREGGIAYFSEAKLESSGWVHLETGAPAPGRVRGIEGVGSFEHGIDVRLSDISWAAVIDTHDEGSSDSR